MGTSPNRILITGFGPFGRFAENPTEHCVRKLAVEDRRDHVRTLVLPVDYRSAFEILRQELAEHPPEFLFLLGLSIGARRLKLELVTRNCLSTQLPDINNFMPDNQRILDNGPETYRTNLDIDRFESFLSKNNLDVERSEDAGDYLCNYVYYRALHLIESENLSTRALFVHTPLTEELLPGLPAGGLRDAPVQTITAATLDQFVRTAIQYMESTT